MLSFGGVNLWKIEQQDLADHYRWANNDNIRRLVGGPPRPRNLAELEAWYKSIIQDPGQEVYSVKSHQAKSLGWIQLSAINHISGSAEVGIVIDEEMWGKGYGHDALVAVIRYAFEDLRLHRLSAEMLTINGPSYRLFTSVGFQAEGKRREAYFTAGRYLDVVELGLLSTEFLEPAPRSSDTAD